MHCRKHKHQVDPMMLPVPTNVDRISFSLKGEGTQYISRQPLIALSFQPL
jgi:hypothetical protein